MGVKEKTQVLEDVRNLLDKDRDVALDEKARLTGFAQAMERSILHISSMIQKVKDSDKAEIERNIKAEKQREDAKKKRKAKTKK